MLRLALLPCPCATAVDLGNMVLGRFACTLSSGPCRISLRYSSFLGCHLFHRTHSARDASLICVYATKGDSTQSEFVCGILLGKRQYIHTCTQGTKMPLGLHNSKSWRPLKAELGRTRPVIRIGTAGLIQTRHCCNSLNRWIVNYTLGMLVKMARM